jgi:hypothetical protein
LGAQGFHRFISPIGTGILSYIYPCYFSFRYPLFLSNDFIGKYFKYFLFCFLQIILAPFSHNTPDDDNIRLAGVYGIGGTSHHPGQIRMALPGETISGATALLFSLLRVNKMKVMRFILCCTILSIRNTARTTVGFL